VNREPTAPDAASESAIKHVFRADPRLFSPATSAARRRE
jgi:hypothetical protein